MNMLAITYFSGPIYLTILLVLLVCFAAARDRWVELLALGAFFLILLAMLTHVAIGEDVRDASGKLITRSTIDKRTETVRAAGTGKVIEVRTTTGKTTVVRDAAGKILRTERK